MKPNVFSPLLSLIVFFGFCFNLAFAQKSATFQSITIDTILKDKISIRAILIDKNTVWYAADRGRFGNIDLEKRIKTQNKITRDTLKIEFRSIAATATDVYFTNIGNPALIYKTAKDFSGQKFVYHEAHEKVFYDSMQFWNDLEGIAIGDPTENCFSIIITRDGGNNWKKLPCSGLPKLVDGEAAFASSNTNIVIKGNKTWLVSGGKKARVFYSEDKGATWRVSETPIVQGKSMTGIFTADFYDEMNGFIAGGDYEAQNQNFGNKAVTNDGGKTWKLVGENIGFGYASCIQYVPGSDGKGLVCVGGLGIHYSSDGGNNWVKLSDDKDLYTIRFRDKDNAIAAGRNKIVSIHFK